MCHQKLSSMCTMRVFWSIHNIFVGNCVTVKITKISIYIRVNNALWYIWTMDYTAFRMSELNYIYQYICNTRAMLSKKSHCRRICLGVPYVYTYVYIYKTLFIYIFKAILCILDLFLVEKHKNTHVGTFLVVHWLRFHAPTAGGEDSSPGRGTKNHMPHGRPK